MRLWPSKLRTENWCSNEGGARMRLWLSKLRTENWCSNEGGVAHAFAAEQTAC